MRSLSESGDTPGPEDEIKDRAVDVAIHYLKLPPEQEESLRRHAHSYEPGEVDEFLAIVSPTLSLAVDGAAKRLGDLRAEAETLIELEEESEEQITWPAGGL